MIRFDLINYFITISGITLVVSLFYLFLQYQIYGYILLNNIYFKRKWTHLLIESEELMNDKKESTTYKIVLKDKKLKITIEDTYSVTFRKLIEILLDHIKDTK